ncbi:MAG TPA: DndE family protein [Mucilaginibacter sp.]|jgi:DNA sulfur modification protein DndE
MFTTIKTSLENKLRVTELTRKLNLGPENVVARLAFSYSLSSGKKFLLSEIKDAKGKEYSKGVLFGNYYPYYISLVCLHYGIYKTDKDIARYIKIHIDHGLELIYKELQESPNTTGFDFLLEKIETGLTFIQ